MKTLIIWLWVYTIYWSLHTDELSIEIKSPTMNNLIYNTYFEETDEDFEFFYCGFA